MSDVTPLFVVSHKGQRKSIYPKVKIDKEVFEPADLIAAIAKRVASSDEPKMGTLKSFGEMTFCEYLLLEILHRTGDQKQADAIVLDSAETYKSAYIFALGVRAGKIFPEELKIETSFDDGSVSVREESAEGDDDPDATPGD